MCKPNCCFRMIIRKQQWRHWCLKLAGQSWAITVFAIDGLGQASGDLVFVIDQLMTAGKHTLAVVETASQGLLAAKCIGSDMVAGNAL